MTTDTFAWLLHAARVVTVVHKALVMDVDAVDVDAVLGWACGADGTMPQFGARPRRRPPYRDPRSVTFSVRG
jgi:hypothetical protein